MTTNATPPTVMPNDHPSTLNEIRERLLVIANGLTTATNGLTEASWELRSLADTLWAEHDSLRAAERRIVDGLTAFVLQLRDTKGEGG